MGDVPGGFSPRNVQNFKLLLFYFKILEHPALFPRILFIYSLSFFCRRESTSRASSGPNTEKGISKIGTQHINDSYFRTACVITMLVNIPYVGSSLLPNSTGKNTEKNIRQYWHYSTRKKMIDLCRIQRTKICGASVSNSLPSPLPLGSRKKVMENLPIFDDFPLKMKVFGVRFRK